MCLTKDLSVSDPYGRKNGCLRQTHTDFRKMLLGTDDRVDLALTTNGLPIVESAENAE